MGTATEVRKLEVFVDGRASTGSDGTGTLDITPGVQVGTAVQIDLRTGFHLHPAQRAGGCAAECAAAIGGSVLTADGNGTVDADLGAACHGQGSECGGLHPLHILRADSAAAGRFPIQRALCIKGDQQRNAGRDRIAACRQHAVRSQHNGLDHIVFGKGIGLIQILEQLVVHTEPGIAGGADKNSLDGHLCSRTQPIAGLVRQQVAGFHIHPAQEHHILAGDSGIEQNAVCQSDLLSHMTVGNSRTVYGDAAHGAFVNKCNVRSLRSRDQADIAQGQRCGALGLDLDGHAAACAQQGSIHAGVIDGLIRNGDTGVLDHTIGKGQGCGAIGFVGNRNNIGLLLHQGARCIHRNHAVRNLSFSLGVLNGNLSVQNRHTGGQQIDALISVCGGCVLPGGCGFCRQCPCRNHGKYHDQCKQER